MNAYREAGAGPNGPPDRPLVAVLTPLGETARADLARIADVSQAGTVAELPEHARRRCRVVIMRSEARLGAAELSQLTALSHVVRPGSGVDNIDTDELGRRGITLHRNADVSAEAVAELALTALTVLCRRMGLGYRWLLDGAYAKHRLTGEPTSRQQLAIWGAGPVGRAVQSRAQRLGLRAAFVAHPSVPGDLPTLPREEAMHTADVHVLALPLRASTRRLVDDAWMRRIARRRPYLVNIARSELLTLDAVANALLAGHLRGCYLDPVDTTDLPELRRFLEQTRDCNVFVTQHQGAQRSDVRVTLDTWAVDTTRAALAHQQEPHPA